MWLVRKSREDEFPCCFILRIGHAHGLMSGAPTIGGVPLARFTGYMVGHAQMRMKGGSCRWAAGLGRHASGETCAVAMSTSPTEWWVARPQGWEMRGARGARRGARARGEGRMPPEKALFAKESPTMRSTQGGSALLRSHGGV